MKISIDVDNRVMTIGKATFTQERTFKNAICFGTHVIDKNDLKTEYDTRVRINENHSNPTAKAMCEVLGISVAKLFKAYKALQYKCFIQPIEKYTRYVPRSGGKISGRWQQFIINNRSICDELLNDGLEKLIPICCVVERTPQQCRELFGKGLWKRLCNLSPTKIGLVAQVLIKYNEYCQHYPIKDAIGHFISLKHRVLRVLNEVNAHTFFDTNDFDMLNWYNDNFAFRYRNVVGYNYDLRRNCGNWFNLYKDTERMAQQLRCEFNPRWSPDIMRLTHDTYIHEQNNRKNAEQSILFNMEYSCYAELQHAISNFDSESYTCIAFRTPKCMLEEGREQHHCIGSYNLDMHHRDNTVLFKLQTKDGKTYSCVQLIKTSNQWQLKQHYKKFNAAVDCTIALQTVNKIVEHLNNTDFCV